MIVPRRAGRRTPKSPSRAAERARRSSCRAWGLGALPFGVGTGAAGVALVAGVRRREVALVAIASPRVNRALSRPLMLRSNRPGWHRRVAASALLDRSLLQAANLGHGKPPPP